MAELRAQVCTGRLVMDVPTDLPDDERFALDDSITRARESAQAGRVHSTQNVMGDSRKRRAAPDLFWQE